MTPAHDGNKGCVAHRQPAATMDHRERHDVVTPTDLLGHLFKNGARTRMSLVLKIQHMSLMIMVPDRSDKADNRSCPTVRDHPLEVGDADRIVNDLGVHDGAYDSAVGHVDILPHHLPRCHVERRPIAASRVAHAPTARRQTRRQRTNKEPNPMMQAWIDTVCAKLNLPSDVKTDLILDVARVAAHNVERPAAPVTTFLLGILVGRGMDVSEAAAKIQELAATWPKSAE